MNSGSRAFVFALLCGAVVVAQCPPAPPFAYGVEALCNGDFEQGTLLFGTPAAGWTTTSTQAAIVQSYTAPGAVGGAVGSYIGGGFFYARDQGGNARIRQTLDLLGHNLSNAALGNLWLEVSAYLGGFGADADSAQVNVIFLNAANIPFQTITLAPIAREHRNSETVLMRRESVILVPTITAKVAIEVAFNYFPCCTAEGIVDNVSAVFTLNAPPATPAPAPLNLELLSNPGFDAGWSGNSPLQLNNPSGWFGETTAAMSVEPYGAASVPGAAVQAYIGGGSRLIRDVGGNGRLSQVIDVSGNAVAISAGALSVSVAGYFGGLANDADHAQVIVRCLDANGVQLGVVAPGPVTSEDRNFETVLVLRRSTVAVPLGTRRLKVELQFTYFPCCTANGLADSLSVMLVPNPTPIPIALNTELLVNGDFESGWTGGSPLTLNDVRSWRGTLAAVQVAAYGSAADLPSTAVRNYVGGVSQLARDAGGDGRLRQYVDLTANAADVDAGLLAVRLSAWLGGHATDFDWAQFNVTFYNASNAPLPSGSVGPVERQHRNMETVLMRRDAVVSVPPSARTALFELQFEYFPCCTANGLADSLSAMLVSPSAPVPQPKSTELLVNGTFELGWTPGSPLRLNDVGSWIGLNGSQAYAEGYGTVGPSIAHSAAIGGGAYYARDVGGASLRQEFNLAGNAGEVDLGALSLHFSGYFGGFGTDPDSAHAIASFLNGAGATLGSVTIGPVTPTDRANQTILMPRTTPVAGTPVPVGTRRLRIDVNFTYTPCCTAFGVADNLSAMLTSSFAGPYQWPGTGEDLLFATGVNAPPTGGPGNDVKGATGGDTAFVLVDSPNGSFDYSPLIVAVNVRPTGSPLLGLGAGIQLNNLNPAAPFLILFDGAATPGAFGAPAVLPGGMNFTFFVPPGLAGTTVRLQAMAFPGLAVAAFMPALPANGIFATTEAHEIVIL